MAHPQIERGVYNTKRWKRFRKYIFAKRHGICEVCGAPGDVVHHIEELTLDNYTDPCVAYGEDNVQVVCWSCHEKTKTKGGIPIRPDIAFDENGNVFATGKRIGPTGRTPPIFKTGPP